MEDMEPSKQASFYNSFRDVVQKITEGITGIQAVETNGHWTKWAKFFQDAALEHLLVSYRDPVPILNNFKRHYQTGALDRSR